jgi:hypothetical protein
MTKTGRITRVLLLVHTYLVLVADVGLWLLVYVLVQRASEAAYLPATKQCQAGRSGGRVSLALAGLAAKTKRGYEDIRRVQD